MPREGTRNGEEKNIGGLVDNIENVLILSRHEILLFAKSLARPVNVRNL